jgi:hypothetical protein
LKGCERRAWVSLGEVLSGASIVGNLRRHDGMPHAKIPPCTRPHTARNLQIQLAELTKKRFCFLLINATLKETKFLRSRVVFNLANTQSTPLSAARFPPSATQRGFVFLSPEDFEMVQPQLQRIHPFRHIPSCAKQSCSIWSAVGTTLGSIPVFNSSQVTIHRLELKPW